MVDVKVESEANEGELLKKIANLEETIRYLEASADPERQSLKNDILQNELLALTTKNHELRVEAKIFDAREAKLKTTINELETQLESVQKGLKASSKVREEECKRHIIEQNFNTLDVATRPFSGKSPQRLFLIVGLLPDGQAPHSVKFQSKPVIKHKALSILAWLATR